MVKKKRNRADTSTSMGVGPTTCGSYICGTAPRETTLPEGRDSEKDLGVYYTDSQVAEFLVWWAVRAPSDTVLDPSFGGGVFLRSACKQIRGLGGDSATQVFGIEIDASVRQAIAEKLHDEFTVADSNLVHSDFFEISPRHMVAANAIVGNPPFIRYQRFAGTTRMRALVRAAEQGLKLSELSSSWLPFLIHSTGFLRPGGRLAMVIPFEIGHASYASTVLEYLGRTFRSVTFLTFRKKLFPNLSEDTLLLLADGKHEVPCGKFGLRDLPHAGALANLQSFGRRRLSGVRELNREEFTSGQRRLIEYLVPRKARELYHELRQSPDTVQLGALTDVGIGYVTGANDFFHINRDTAAEWGIPKRFLRACVRRGRALVGLRFTEEDWRLAVPKGEAGYLLELPSEKELPSGVQRYLAKGKELGVHLGFKCRTRKPWYRVPHVHHPDAFLTYMSGDAPRLVANVAGVVAPNTLHVLRLQREAGVTPEGVAALWQTSLARLSTEIEGHSLGGGMLKLEPGEAEAVVLPYPHKLDHLDSLAAELDDVSREKGHGACSLVADDYLLHRSLGLSSADCELLRSAGLALRNRRMSRA